MNLINTTFAVVAILIGIMLWMIVNSNRSVSQRIVAICAGVICLGAGFFAMTELLARPKPVALEWMQREAEEATVLGSKFVEGEAIYVWVQLDGEPAPRSYVLPWSEQNAVAMHRAQQQAETDGTQVRMRKPFRKNNQNVEPQFYAQPQQPPPPKEVEIDTPRVFGSNTD